jgi:hypothetical protein
MGKGSGRRIEDTKKVESNPFWENTTFAKNKKEKEHGSKSNTADTKKTQG